MAKNDRAEIEWAPRVSLSKIRALYLNEARGTAGDDLVNEVGYALLWRCQSIFEFTQACAGKVRCKRCARAGVATMLERQTARPSEVLRCTVCGWQVQWRVYLKESEKVDGQLHAGHAGAAFERYIRAFPGCRSREEKVVAIDQLIHEFHWILLDEEKAAAAHKPAGVNLLRGTSEQVVALLNELTYGEHTPPQLREELEWWKAQRPIARRKANE